MVLPIQFVADTDGEETQESEVFIVQRFVGAIVQDTERADQMAAGGHDGDTCVSGEAHGRGQEVGVERIGPGVLDDHGGLALEAELTVGVGQRVPRQFLGLRIRTANGLESHEIAVTNGEEDQGAVVIAQEVDKVLVDPTRLGIEEDASLGESLSDLFLPGFRRDIQKGPDSSNGGSLLGDDGTGVTAQANGGLVKDELVDLRSHRIAVDLDEVLFPGFRVLDAVSNHGADRFDIVPHDPLNIDAELSAKGFVAGDGDVVEVGEKEPVVSGAENGSHDVVKIFDQRVPNHDARATTNGVHSDILMQGNEKVPRI